MTLDSDFFFSRLAKYLVFFSFCSIICALERVMYPLSLFSIIVSSSFLLFSISCLSLSFCSGSSELVNSVSNCYISLV